MISGGEYFINKNLCGFKETGILLGGWMELSGHSWHHQAITNGFYEQGLNASAMTVTHKIYY